MDHRDPSQMRISDADREKVAEVLREAAGEGRIDIDELEERLEATYAAKVYADLVPITLDLPGQHAPAPVHPVAGPAVPGGVPVPDWQTSFAVMWGTERKGLWEVPATHTAFAMMGSVELDLRQARFAARETVIYANAIMGAVEITVNAHTHVIVDGTGVMGDFSMGREKVPAQLDASSPVVRVKGIALMGAVNVMRKRMPGEPGVFKRLLG